MNPNLRCLKKACNELHIPYEDVGKSGVFVSVTIQGRPYHFIANGVPFNNSTVARIALDKSYTYDLLSSVVRMPHTLSYLDPNCEEIYQPYVIFHSQKEISDAIQKSFSLPVVLKMNVGKRGENVFACKNTSEIEKAVAAIFDKKSHLYDYILLAQEHIDVQKEYRVTVFEKKIILMYEKDISQAQFSGNLSPLHWEGAKAVIVEDQELQKRIETFIAPIFEKLDLQYAGLDIALGTNNQLCLFELNTQPGYQYLIKDNGDEPLVEIYRKMLTHLVNPQY